MALHLRQQIVAAMTTAVTGLSTTGARVARSRTFPAQETELPCLRLRFARGTEASQARSMPAPRLLERHCRIEVVAYAEDLTDVEAALNAICKEVEEALAMPASLGPWQTLTLVATDIDSSGAGERPIGEAVMTYQAIYLTRETTPDVKA